MSRGRGRGPTAQVKEDDSGAMTVDRFLGQYMEHGGYVVIYRSHPRTKKQEYCGRRDLEWSANMENVVEAWGGGTFQFRVYDADGKYLKAFSVDVAAPFKDLTTATEPESPKEQEQRRAEEVQATEDRLRGLKMEERLFDFKREIVDLVRGVQTAPPQAQQQDFVTSTIALVKALQDIMVPHTQTPAADSPSPWDIFEMGLEFGRRDGGGDGDGNSYATVLRTLGPRAFSLLEKALGGDAAAMADAAHQVGPGSPPPGEGPRPNPPPQDDTSMTLRDALARWVPMLLAWADQRRDPALYANFVLDQLPPVWRDKLGDFLEEQGGSAITVLIGWFPGIATHRAWFSELLENLNGLMFEEDGNADPGELGVAEPIQEEEE